MMPAARPILFALGATALVAGVWYVSSNDVGMSTRSATPTATPTDGLSAVPSSTSNIPAALPTAKSYFDMTDPSRPKAEIKIDDMLLAARTRTEAERGNATAQFNLALLYDQGRGVPEDPKEAVRWYTLAAEQGDVRAQRNLGYMFDAGRGAPQDDGAAAEWYRRAAEQGDAGGQNNLATMYYLGRGVARDFTEAARWFRAAADQGDAGAQHNLGRMLLEGTEIPQDPFEAYSWCGLAARNLTAEGSRAHALKCRNRAATLLDPKQLAEAELAVRDWVPVTTRATNQD